jgi:hypothetical protein
MAAATAAGVRPGRGSGADRRRRCGGRIDKRDQQHDCYRAAQHGLAGETTQPRTTAAKSPRGDRHRHQRATAAPATTAAAATHHDGGTDDDADHHDDADDHHHNNDHHHNDDHVDHDHNNDNNDDNHADDDHNNDNHADDDHHDHHHADDDTDDDDLHNRAVRAGADSDSGAAEPVSGSALPLTQTPDGGQRPMMRAIAVMVMNSLSADRAVIFNDRVSKRS